MNLTAAVMAVPQRAHRLEALAAAIDPLTPQVICDDALSGDTWSMFRRCLLEGKRGTHRIVLQDDALPVEGFAAAVRKLVALHPRRLICLYVPALPAAFGRQMLVAHAAGAEVVELTKGVAMFVPLVATVWPVELADRCAQWPGHQRGPHGAKGRADDARVADWLRAHRPPQFPLAAVPCLVDHDEGEPSSLDNGGRYPRRAAILPDTPVGTLTIA